MSVITMVRFDKGDLQSAVDSIKDALKEEFADEDTLNELKEARRSLVAAIKYSRGKGVVLLTPGECGFLHRALQAASYDLFVDEDVRFGLQELVDMFDYRSASTQKVAI